MPLHTPQLCPECGTPLTSTDYCSQCETQREGVRPGGDKPASNGVSAKGAGNDAPNGGGDPTRRRAAVVAIAGAAGVTAVVGSAMLIRQERLSRRRGFLRLRSPW